MNLRTPVVALLVAFAIFFSLALRAAEVPKITKVDPPNWWAGMPKPMLLVKGEDLNGAEFTLGRSNLSVDSVRVSANGHWAEVWLSSSPSKPETVTLRAHTSAGDATVPYRFEHRRIAN